MTLAPHTHHSRITVCVCVCVGGYSYHWKALLSFSFLSAYLSNIMSCTLGACTYTPPGILGYQCVCVCRAISIIGGLYLYILLFHIFLQSCLVRYRLAHNPHPHTHHQGLSDNMNNTHTHTVHTTWQIKNILRSRVTHAGHVMGYCCHGRHHHLYNHHQSPLLPLFSSPSPQTA